MRAFIGQLLLLAALTLLSLGLYAALFWTGVGASVTILFYRGVLLALVVSLVIGIAAAWLARKTRDTSLPIAAAALSLSVNICFLVLFPVTIDRSVTVYLLSTIERQQDAGMTPSALQAAFVDGYAIKMDAVGRRIDEQRKSGNVEVAPDGRVRLTPQGERFMAFSRVIARLFKTDPRFVGTPAPENSSSRK